MNIETEEFRDNAEYLYEFADEFLVVCPRCGKQAKVVFSNGEGTDQRNFLFAPRKLICPACGYLKERTGGSEVLYSVKKEASHEVVIGGNFDWYFQEPLWLQTACCNEILWAYNQRHLRFLQIYVSAKLRTRTPNLNRTLASRLPKWIKAAKNRDEILRAITRIKAK